MEKIVWATALGLTLWVMPAQATVVITGSQSGGDVVFQGSGTIDFSALSPSGIVSGRIPFVNASSSSLRLGATANEAPFDDYQGLSASGGSFGSGLGTAVGVGTGDILGVGLLAGTPLIIVPSGYVSGDPLSGTATFAGESFATLGLTPGTHVWSWGSVLAGNDDSLTLTIPEPGAASLLLASALVAAWGVRRSAGASLR